MTTTPPADTATALWTAIRYAAGDFIRDGDEQAIGRAITAHVEAEVARRLAAAPEVEAAIVDYAHAAQSDFDTHAERADLRAAIAADKARAVEAESIAAIDEFRRILTAPRPPGVPCPACKVARLTPDEARRLVDAFVRAVSPARYDKDTALTARTALLRALGVEA